MTPVRPLVLLIAPLMMLGLASPSLSQTAKPAPAAAAEATDDLPAGAPRDDYEFVGWCAGALTGHMALYEQVQPTLKQISKRWNTEAADEVDYAAKQVAGRDLLQQFAEAMKAAERASNQAIAPRGARAIAQGRDKWAAIATVDENTRAYSWLNWGLPERCERVAGQLKSRATLMGAVLRDNSKSAVQASAVRAVGERPAEDPAARAAATPSAVIASAPQAAEPQVAAPQTIAPPPAVPNPAPARPAAGPTAKPAAKPAPKPAAKKPASAPTSTAAANGLRGSVRAD
jgi:hypothetical protein